MWTKGGKSFPTFASTSHTWVGCQQSPGFAINFRILLRANDQHCFVCCSCLALSSSLSLCFSNIEFLVSHCLHTSHPHLTICVWWFNCSLMLMRLDKIACLTVTCDQRCGISSLNNKNMSMCSFNCCKVIADQVTALCVHNKRFIKPWMRVLRSSPCQDLIRTKSCWVKRQWLQNYKSISGCSQGWTSLTRTRHQW